MDDDLPPGSPQPPAPRAPGYLASDAEREACVAVLRAGCEEGRLTLAEFTDRMHAAYASRTDAELAELVRDLPAAPRVVGGVAGARARRSPVTGRPGVGASVGIMSGCERKGAWTVARTHSAVAVMGGVELDLRAAGLEAAETDIVAVAIMGGIEIVVPEDWDVRVTGFAVMGGHEERRRRRPLAPDAPVVHIRAYALMGGVEVVTKDAAGKKPRRAELRAQERRELDG